MNRNSKGRFNVAKKAAASGQKTSVFQIPKIVSGIGERATWATYGTKEINFTGRARMSRKPKVAGGKPKRSRNWDEVDTTAIPVKQIIKVVETPNS